MKQKFNQMLVTLEACYSGSIFDQNLLKSNLSIYAITASNSKEESFAEFYDLKKDTYLSDIFTQNWINSWISCEKTDSTLAEQYEIVRNRTNTSHVSQFGNLNLAKSTKINDFLYPSAIKGLANQKCINRRVAGRTSPDRLVSPSSDVKFTAYEHLSKQDKLSDEHTRVIEELRKGRHFLKEHILKLSERLAGLLNLSSTALLNHDEMIEDRECYEQLVHVYHQNCFKINEHTYLSRYLQIFYKACNALINDKMKSTKIKQLETAIIEQCKSLEPKDFKIKIQ